MARPRPLSRLWPVYASLTAALLAVAPAARAQDAAEETETTAYANITDAAIERFTNAVRITLQADGLVKAEPDYEFMWDQWFETEDGDYGLNALDEVPFVMRDTRSQLGTFVDIATYPVSHLVFQPVTRGTRTDLICTLVLYRPAGCLSLFGDFDWTDATYWREHRNVPLYFSIVSSQTSTEIIITVRSDQYAEPAAGPPPEPQPGDASWLRLGEADGLFTIDAVNVPLSRLLEALGERSRARLALSTRREPWVTLNLPSGRLVDVLDAVSACYGLSWSGSGAEGYVVSDGRATDLQSYESATTELIQCRYVPAKDLLNLLPHVLLPYVSLDAENNGLAVTGPRALVEKLRADVRVLDQPAPLIEVEALVLTHADERARDAVWNWEAGWSDAGLTLASDAAGYASGGLLGGETEGLLALPRPAPPGGWAATVSALARDGHVTLLARPSARVLNGHAAELFVGETRYITKEATRYDAGGIRPIRTGVAFTATPVAGPRGDITCRFEVEVSGVLSVDPKTKLPTSANRTMAGTMRVLDGDSIVIGGLLTGAVSTHRRALPILEEAPLLRDLFGLRKTESRDEDVLVLLSARRLLDPALGPDATRSMAILESEAEGDAAEMEDPGVDAREFVRAVRTGRSLGEY